MADPTASICKACGKPKWRHHYLCRACWRQLPQQARNALNLHDARAVRRLSDLHEQLRARVALNKIVIADG